MRIGIAMADRRIPAYRAEAIGPWSNHPLRAKKPTGIIRFMAQIVFAFSNAIRTTDGTSYTVTACGRERSGGTWEGWLEFAPGDASPVLRSGRETSQPNLVDLRYWATGLTPVYLEGALARALKGPPKARSPVVPKTSAYDAPAPSPTVEETSAQLRRGRNPFLTRSRCLPRGKTCCDSSCTR